MTALRSSGPTGTPPSETQFRPLNAEPRLCVDCSMPGNPQPHNPQCPTYAKKCPYYWPHTSEVVRAVSPPPALSPPPPKKEERKAVRYPIPRVTVSTGTSPANSQWAKVPIPACRYAPACGCTPAYGRSLVCASVRACPCAGGQAGEGVIASCVAYVRVLSLPNV